MSNVVRWIISLRCEKPLGETNGREIRYRQGRQKKKLHLATLIDEADP